ncbi:MAG: 2-oxo acid dehydrogenase subunit E2 [Cyanobacteria bacterium]|nr:2-oxo acid dehydrogenase subunit E2 [Cyanobacteriota bacterium]
MLRVESSSRSRLLNSDESESSPATIGVESRYRWNVLDMLMVIGGHAVSGHLFADIDMSVIEESRKKMEDEGTKVSVTAYILKAIAMAQTNHPLSRTFPLPFSQSVKFGDIVAGITVEREVDGKPIVFFGEIEEPQSKSVIDLARLLHDYAYGEIMSVDKLRQQVIFARLPQVIRRLVLLLGLCFPSCRLMCMGATFGLSSLGALGVTAVFGPSVCTCVFGVGAIEQRVVARNGKLVIRPMMTLTLSYDQTVFDGAPAARFLHDTKVLLENGLETRSNRSSLVGSRPCEIPGN